MMSLARIEHLIERVTFRDWQFRVLVLGEGWLVQAMFPAAEGPQRGRKWYISAHAIESEVVQTLFIAVLTAVEHEAREDFAFDGVPIFGPHKTLDALRSSAAEAFRADGKE